MLSISLLDLIISSLEQNAYKILINNRKGRHHVTYLDVGGCGWYFIVAFCVYSVNGCSYIFSLSGWNVPCWINFKHEYWGGGGGCRL